MEFNSELIAQWFRLTKPNWGREEDYGWMEINYFCLACHEVISGKAYVDYANHCIHESCAKLEGKIVHPLHPYHTLTLRLLCYSNYQHFVCNGCGDFSANFAFNCDEGCDFNLDIKCGLLGDDYFSKYDRQTLETRNRKANIYHFSHPQHSLTLCHFRKTHIFSKMYSFCCFCNQSIIGSAYSCFDCYFSVHESCKDQMQEQVKSKLHPHHSLISCVEKFDYQTCKACKGRIADFCYSCNRCNFKLHGGCDKYYTRPIKHNCHSCKLFYFKHDDERSENFICCVCMDISGAVYRCVDCDVNFHPKCIPIPSMVEAECHGDHPLKLVDSVNGYDFPAYYCDSCEEELNPKHHHYYCEECPYFAHIDCVLPQDGASLEDTKENKHRERHGESNSSEQVVKEKASSSSDAEQESDTVKERLGLNFELVGDLSTLSEEEETFCILCGEVISGQAYSYSDRNQKKQHWLHESCAKLPGKITHPHHSHHSLTLLSKTPNNKAGHFICNVCGDFSTSYTFNCQFCPFNLDVKCGSFHNTLRDRNTKPKIHNYFGHEHILKLCNFRRPLEFYCSFCEQIIYGSAYSCLDCEFFIHESCKDMRQIINQFHPQHSLFAHKCVVHESCTACRDDITIGKFYFRCDDCRQFNLHIKCNKPPLRPFKHMCHYKCDLFYFSYHEWTTEFYCHICRRNSKAPVYRCVHCNKNFHLDCIPLPSTLQVTCTNHHPLKLVDSLNGHDFPLYYCDVCEEEGSPKDHLYYCEKCPYLAHIDCVLPQEFKPTITFFGAKNAGKTSLVNVIGGDGYDEDTIPSVEPTVTKVTSKRNITFELLDVGGQPNNKWEQYCNAVFAIIYVVDAARSHYSLENSKRKLHYLLGRPNVRNSNIPLLVLGNKIDQPRALSKEAFAKKMGLEFIIDREVWCIMISCKDLTNIDFVFKWGFERWRINQLNSHRRSIKAARSNQEWWR